MSLAIWSTLGIIAIIILIITFFIGKNSVWGTLTFGIVIALIVGIINIIRGTGFGWELSKKILIISILAGAFFEVLGRLTNVFKKSKN